MIDTSQIRRLQPVYTPYPVNRQHPANRGKVAWWLCLPHLMGGVYWRDIWGLNPGTLTNMTTTASGWRGTTRQGGFGHLLLDGADDYVEKTSFSVSGDQLTLTAWIYISAIPADSNRKVISLGDGSNSQHYIDIAYVSGVAHARMVINNTGAAVALGSTSLAANTWYRVVGTYNRAGGTVTIYVNGQSDGTATYSTAAVSTSVLDVGIDNAHVSSRAFGGAIDDAAVYNRALSAETRADYDLSRQGYPGVLNRIAPRFFSLSAVIYNQTLSATCTPSASIIKQINSTKSASSAGAGTLTKQTTKPLSASSAGVGVFVKSCGKTLSASSVGAGTLVKQARKTLTAVTTGAASLVKTAGKVFAAVCTSVATWIASTIPPLIHVITSVGQDTVTTSASTQDSVSTTAHGDDNITTGGGTA